MLNKGIGGEEASQMVARFDADVIDENPDLVLWQVGSNSVLRDHPTPGEIIRQGVERLKASGAEVILINPQYAPKILAKPDIGHVRRRHHGDRARRGGRPVRPLRGDAPLGRDRAAWRSSSSSRPICCT